MKATDYPIFVIWSERDEAFLARVVDLPGCMADGKTRQEAVENAQLTIEEWLETAQEMGWSVPPPQEDAALEASTLKNANEQKQQFQEAVHAEVQRALEQLVPQIAARLSSQFQPSKMPSSRMFGHFVPQVDPVT